MKALSSIAFRIPLLVVLLSALMAGSVWYLVTQKMTEGYTRVETEGAQNAVLGIAPLVSQKAATGDCNGTIALLEDLAGAEEIVAVSVRTADINGRCEHLAGSPERGTTRSQPVFDNDRVKIGEVSVTYSLDAMHRAHLKDFYQRFGIILGVYFILLFFVLNALVNMLRPLDEVAGAMEHFNPESPSGAIMERTGSDEVSRVARAAAAMFEKLVGYAGRIHDSNTTAVHSEAHLKEAQRMSRTGSWEYSLDSAVFGMSTEMYRILHMNTKNDKVTWEQFLAFVAEEDREYVNEVIGEAVEHGSKFRMGYRISTANGDLIDVHTHGKVRKKADGKVRITGVTRDVTEQNRTQEMMEQLAYFDVLTRLPNRALFKDRLGKALESAKRSHTKVGLLFLDLDHFKLINDTLGHHVGDNLLVYVAELLNRQLRGSDTIARIGGDEFVVMLPQLNDEDDAPRVAEKLLASLEGQHIIERHTLFVSTSIGISIFPEHAEDVGELIKRADTAMYEAKQKGRNNYQVYNDTMGGQQYGQMLLEEELYEAVKKGDQFELYYQPQLDAKTKRVCGVEALLRWHHPEQGMLDSDLFVPLLESSGLIVETGQWVIETAVAQAAAWHAEGREMLPISINLSARQLHDPALVESVATAIASHGVDARWIGFEISEAILIANVERNVPLLERLKKIGVLLAMDDYGSGAAPVPVLSQFPLDMIKIDQRFVAEMIDEPSELANIAAMLAVGRSLEYLTVIEGIETAEEEAMVLPLGCDIVQGYLYAKPMPKDGLELFLAK